MKDKVLQLLRDGMNIDDIAEELCEEKCMAVEFKENMPIDCYGLGDCFDCWKKKIQVISKEI